MARAIVRISIDAPPGTGGHPQTARAKRSLGAPFSSNPRTGTVEATSAPSHDVIQGLIRLLEHVDRLPEGFMVDHLWIYFDKKGSRRRGTSAG